MEREDWMRLALALAREAGEAGEVPVGLRDREGRLRGGPGPQPEGGGAHRPGPRGDRGHCRRLPHPGGLAAEDCTLYVTLEPCPMCAGAIVNARIPVVCYGAKDDKAGCCGSVLNLFEERFNHHPRVYGHILEEECAGLLQEFFENLR